MKITADVAKKMYLESERVKNTMALVDSIIAIMEHRIEAAARSGKKHILVDADAEEDSELKYLFHPERYSMDIICEDVEKMVKKELMHAGYDMTPVPSHPNQATIHWAY